MCWWLLQALTIGRHYYRYEFPSGQGQVGSPPAELALVFGDEDEAAPFPPPYHPITIPFLVDR